MWTALVWLCLMAQIWLVRTIHYRAATCTHHAVKFQISVEPNGPVGAVKIECDIRKLSPALFLKLI